MNIHWLPDLVLELPSEVPLTGPPFGFGIMDSGSGLA